VSVNYKAKSVEVSTLGGEYGEFASVVTGFDGWIMQVVIHNAPDIPVEINLFDQSSSLKVSWVVLMVGRKRSWLSKIWYQLFGRKLIIHDLPYPIRIRPENDLCVRIAANKLVTMQVSMLVAEGIGELMTKEEEDAYIDRLFEEDGIPDEQL